MCAYLNRVYGQTALKCFFNHDGTDDAEPLCDAERHELHSHAEHGNDIQNNLMPYPQPLPQKCFSTTMALTTQIAT
ncbi:hypothetical protein AO354_07220 [Pseudomonas syringae pv. syringae]|nr:hypothetical protein AL061_20885 [Pseudomonas syringae pv. syringae]PHX52937.1 hypothetical protein AO354_07220 [Pseudomonas syringae pv. syringae]